MMRKYFNLPVDGESAAYPGYRLSTITPENPGLKDCAGTDADEGNTGSSWIIPAQILNQRTQAPPEKIKIFQVQENLMEPDYKRGEYVLVDISDNKPSPPGPFIISDGFGYMLRLCAYSPKSNPPQLKISALNDGFQTQTLGQDEIDIIGRVIAKLQWL